MKMLKWMLAASMALAGLTVVGCANQNCASGQIWTQQYGCLQQCPSNPSMGYLNGSCVSTSGQAVTANQCPTGTMCYNGQCLNQYNGQPSGQMCSMQGTGTCPTGTMCYNGQCLNQYNGQPSGQMCSQTGTGTCPTGTMCYNGQCLNQYTGQPSGQMCSQTGYGQCNTSIPGCTFNQMYGRCINQYNGQAC